MALNRSASSDAKTHELLERLIALTEEQNRLVSQLINSIESQTASTESNLTDIENRLVSQLINSIESQTASTESNLTDIERRLRKIQRDQ